MSRNKTHFASHIIVKDEGRLKTKKVKFKKMGKSFDTLIFDYIYQKFTKKIKKLAHELPLHDVKWITKEVELI